MEGRTAHPTSEWGTQQVRQLIWTMKDEQLPIRFPIHDRDTKFATDFDTVFAAEEVKVIRTPYRAPRANEFAERWIRSASAECLDRLLILNEGHLRRVMREYIGYYNQARPHQGIEQRCPIPINSARTDGTVKHRDMLGGIIHDYHREAA